MSIKTGERLPEVEFRVMGSEGPKTVTTSEVFGGKRTALPYWRIPDRLLDDPAELADWARASLAVARARKAAMKPATRKKRR